jgi:glucuronate isomerase
VGLDGHTVLRNNVGDAALLTSRRGRVKAGRPAKGERGMPGTFIRDDFLLGCRRAVELYEAHARDLPIVDFHSHLPPRDIAADRRFADLTEIWLEGDHYKWRAMRSDGVDERLCTGDAPPREKFLAWARTVPRTLRNPLYHWTHLELRRAFGIDALLDGRTAPAVWEEANRLLAGPGMTARGILRKFRVEVAATTDDPADSLEHHRALAASGFEVRVVPTFRPDAAFGVDRPEAFNPWVDRLAAAADTAVGRLDGLLEALRRRHDEFGLLGCRLSDHGLERCPADFPSDAEAARIFDRARSGTAASPEEKTRFASHLMLFFGRLDAGKGWTKQLHLGAIRNANGRLFRRLGPDRGFDSIGDWPQAAPLAALLDRLDREGALPRTILYNLNPADNHVFASMLGNFQDGSVPGKLGLGSAWWFLDQKDGIEGQLEALSNLGLLSRFVGMVTDSRSFLSFPRHEYFRRVLCNLIGRDVEAGLLPDDEDLLGPLIEGICILNPRGLFPEKGPGASTPP